MPSIAIGIPSLFQRAQYAQIVTVEVLADFPSELEDGQISVRIEYLNSLSITETNGCVQK